MITSEEMTQELVTQQRPFCHVDEATKPVSVATPQVRIKIRRKMQLIIQNGHGQAANTPERVINDAIAGGLKVLASRSVPNGNGGVRLLVVEDDSIAREALDAAAVKYCTESVLLVEASPRVPAITRLAQCVLRSNINVLYSYAVPNGNSHLTAVFKTQDDDGFIQTVQRAVRDGMNESGGTNFKGSPRVAPHNLEENIRFMSTGQAESFEAHEAAAN
jgi:hypothetical protein